MPRKSDINIRIGADIKAFSSAMQNVERQMKKIGKQMTKTGKTLTKNVTLPLVALGAISVKVFADFEQGMAKVKAISGATDEEFKALRKSALDLGRTTRFTSAQVAELQLNLSKLGLTPAEINKSTAAILDLSLATGEDLAMSATVAASTMRGFGLAAEDMVRITDVMANSFSSTSLDLNKFATAMGVVAPVANVAGASLEQTTALLGVLTNRGVDASSAGAALRNIFLDLADNGLKWSDAMQMLNKSTNPLADAMKLFGKRGAAVATIIANNRDEIRGLTTDFNDSTGEAKRMAGIMDDTLTGAMLQLKSAFEGAAISIGKVLAPVITKIASVAKDLANRFTDLNDSTKKTILIVAALAATLGPVLLILGKVAVVLPILAKGLLLLSGPIGISIALLGALAAALFIFNNASKSAIDITKDLDTIQKKHNKNLKESEAAINNEIAAIKASNAGTSLRTSLLKAFNDKHGTTISDLKDEVKFTKQLNEVQKEIIDNIRQEIALAANKEKLTKLIKQENFLTAQQNVLKENLADTNRHLSAQEAEHSTQKIKDLGDQITKIKELQAQLAKAVTFKPIVTPDGDDDIDTDAATKVAPTIEGLKSLGATKELWEDIKADIIAANKAAAEFWAAPEKIKIGFIDVEDTIKSLGQKIREIVAAAVVGFSQLFSTIGAFQDKRNQELENEFARRKQIIEETVGSEESKGQKLAALDKEFEEKRREQARKTAKLQKAQSIFAAVINGFEAVSKALAVSGPILATVVGGLAASQVAAISATPLPALAHGGLAFGETAAIVGDNPRARANPEVIAPLDRLKDMIGGAVSVQLSGMVLGEQLVLLTERTKRRQGRTR